MQILAFSHLKLNPFTTTTTAGKKPPNSTAFRKTPPPPISAVTSSAAFPYKDRTTLLPPILPPEKVQIFKSLESWAFQHVVPLLKPVENSWQPTEFLPNPVQDFDHFTGEVRELRERALELPDEYLVVLVGDLITEDALPTYQSMLNRLDGAKDETGASPSPWAVWTRGWTAEEKRHGDLLKTYLYLSGRVDMVMIEKTMHYLLSYGMNTGTNTNPYIGFVYTSFQERATFVSHGNTARLAKIAGDPVLAKICGTIAADEKRHETAYSRIVGKLIELDPDGVMSAIGEMMRMKITMPGHLMYDGRDPNLFANYSAVAQRLGIYTAGDYADILVFLIQFWGLEKLEGLTAKGKRAQEFVCGLPQRIIRLQEKADERAKKTINSAGVKFSWIFDKEISL